MAHRAFAILALGLLLFPVAAQASLSIWMYTEFSTGYNPLTADFHFNGGSRNNVHVGPWKGYFQRPGTPYADFYCVDLGNSMPSGWHLFQVDPTDQVTPPAPAASGGLRWASALYNNVAPTLEGLMDNTSKMKRAALQISLWEALYDWNPADPYAYDVSDGGGDFYVTNLDNPGSMGYGSAEVMDQVNTYLADSRYQHQGVSNYWDNGQNLIGPVPEPSTLMLLGLGLIGSATFAYKRRRR